ncbi:MAG: carbohydrate ABC transporter permease [Demequina sp.]
MTPVALEKRPKRNKRGTGARRDMSPAARRRSLTGWAFLIPAAALIGIMMFWPMFQALLLSFQTGRGSALDWADPLLFNYERMLNDDIFRLTLTNTLLYLVIQVPIMLISALVLANILNNPRLRWKGFWRTAIFVPAAISLVSYSLVFRTIFATDGLVNDMLLAVHLIDSPINWLGNTDTARLVIILGLLWRWTGFNVIFYLAALQNIDPTTLEAAKMDGAGPIRTFFSVTIPQMKPMILLTVIMSTNGTIQMFDESYNLTRGGPANTTMTMSHYLFDVSFQNNPNFGYGAALSYVILIIVAVLAAIQMKVGDKRD